MKKNNEIIELITHDLKSPLTVLKGTMDFLSMDLNEENNCNSDCKQAIKIMNRSIKNMEEMIDSILVSNLIETNEAMIERIQVNNLTYILREYCKNFKYDMQSKGITFKTYIQKDLPPVLLDLKRVKNHILNNIITNAMKFTPSQGCIKFSAFEDINEIVIVIEDSGAGIPKEERKNIFKKRKKLNTKTIRTCKSFGLGLYNASYFTALHGGMINVSDSVFKKGTAFTIRFPKENV